VRTAASPCSASLRTATGAPSQASAAAAAAGVAENCVPRASQRGSSALASAPARGRHKAPSTSDQASHRVSAPSVSAPEKQWPVASSVAAKVAGASGGLTAAALAAVLPAFPPMVPAMVPSVAVAGSAASVVPSAASRGASAGTSRSTTKPADASAANWRLSAGLCSAATQTGVPGTTRGDSARWVSSSSDSSCSSSRPPSAARKRAAGARGASGRCQAMALAGTTAITVSARGINAGAEWPWRATDRPSGLSSQANAEDGSGAAVSARVGAVRRITSIDIGRSAVHQQAVGSGHGQGHRRSSSESLHNRTLLFSDVTAL